jgi:A/G-specific adenine glycosylase
MQRALSQLRGLPRLRRGLLAWYDAHRRDLPWRKTHDPYRIWVSEIMLQQTRVAAVLPRYEKFLRRFPEVQKLAAAREASVLAEWSGLGYYRRARNLHAAAKVIVRDRAGVFPGNARDWEHMPGIGRYTAAAIASIAFDEPVAVLDGNVKRVVRRLTYTCSEKELWNIAESLLDRNRPGDFNQALMELGAVVCLPGEPLCARCPIRRFCRTRGRGSGPTRGQQRAKRKISYALIRKDDAVRLVRRSDDESLMPAMWELPRVSTDEQSLFTLRHSITVTDYVVSVVGRTLPAKTQGIWVPIARLRQLPLTGLTKKILRRAQIIQ